MIRIKQVRKYLFLFGISGLIIALDQVTKYWVRQHLLTGETWVPWPWLAPIARIVNWHNTGAAFGMFQDGGPIFAILAVIVSFAIIYYFQKLKDSEILLKVAMAMQLAGAVGNLIDRLYQGYVTDFISLGNFAVFNVADSSITIGVGVLLLGVWLEERKIKKNLENKKETTVEIVEKETLNQG